MKWKSIDRRTGLNIIGAIILLIGLGSAILIYRTAENVPVGVLGYEGGDGGAYPVMPDDSKKYLRDLELYGGKANVLMDQFRRWFIGLWQGESLAYTIAGITIFISLGVFYVANHWPSDLETDGHETTKLKIGNEKHDGN
ncbi:MAG: hypothetical protein WA974_05425 [Thermodesulfobacteriota bacterium]